MLSWQPASVQAGQELCYLDDQPQCRPGTVLSWRPASVQAGQELCYLDSQPQCRQVVEKIVKHDSWPMQPDILSPPLLRLTSRKPLWLDLQPVDIKSRWRHNWKSAQVVNSHLVCDPTIRQPGFDFPRQQWSLLNRFRTEQGLRCLQKEMATYRHWSVSLWRDPDDVLNPVPWQNWMADYLGYTLRMRTLFRGWPVMVNDTHMRRRRP